MRCRVLHLTDMALDAATLASAAESVGATLVACADDGALAQALASNRDGQNSVVVLDAAAPRVLSMARHLAQHAPDARFVFVVRAEDEDAFRQRTSYAGPPGGRWSMARAGTPDLRERLAAELAAAGQQHRLRTTLDRMKLRLAPPAPVDSGEYRRLVASDRYLASVLRHAHDAIVSIDSAGRVVSWNEGAVHLFGLSAEQARRGRLERLFDDTETAADAISAALAGSFRTAGLDIGRSGAVRHVDANFGPLRDDTNMVIGVVAILRDVTERHDAEEELRAASRQKDEFLAMLAHELRNPLAPIRNAAQILMLLGQETPAARRPAEIILRQTDHMVALIDDLLDMARLNRGAIVLQPEQIDVADIASDAIEQARGLMEGRQQRFSYDAQGPLTVVGDRKRLTQVVANLLINAAKYTPPGGAIALDLHRDAGQVVVRVADTGIGMDAALVDRVFDLFVQAERSPDRSEGGLGVGLALVRSLVGMHGGAVSAHSDGPGRGSVFEVRLPAVEAGVLVDAHPIEARDATGSARDVLVVDDNEDAAHTLGTLLRVAGHRVDVHTDPRSAMERARLEPPDVYVLDIGMPHIDGYEFARRVRAMPAPRRPLLIALTGYGHATDRARALEAGFDHHLIKPLDPRALLDALGPAAA